jgi:hypothetical protein
MVGLFPSFMRNIFSSKLNIDGEGASKMRIEDMCRAWLEDNFKISPKIEGYKILPRKEIDKALGLVGIKFDFTSQNLRGESTAFLDFYEVFQASNLKTESLPKIKSPAI